MLTQLIQEHAEARFLSLLEQADRSSVPRNVLLSHFSRVGVRADPDELLRLSKDILRDHNGALFFCADGDLLIAWHGKAKDVLQALVAKLTTHYCPRLSPDAATKLFRYFDGDVAGEDLRLICRAKLQQRDAPARDAATAVEEASLPVPSGLEAVFAAKQIQDLHTAIAHRGQRKKMEILIVDDQAFSRTLLTSVFGTTYVCHAAKDAAEALQMYATHAPDATFLDIELPDANGHALAALFRKFDPDGRIVMVTANHYAKDVAAARANGVHGFVAKPYNKQKIIDALDACFKRKGTPHAPH